MKQKCVIYCLFLTFNTHDLRQKLLTFCNIQPKNCRHWCWSHYMCKKYLAIRASLPRLHRCRSRLLSNPHAVAAAEEIHGSGPCLFHLRSTASGGRPTGPETLCKSPARPSPHTTRGSPPAGAPCTGNMVFTSLIFSNLDLLKHCFTVVLHVNVTTVNYMLCTYVQPSTFLNIFNFSNKIIV